jgi:hypothetical protein
MFDPRMGQLGQPRVNLTGTIERATLEGDKVKIENIAFDKAGAELIVATKFDTVARLEARKASLEAEAANIGKILDAVSISVAEEVK